MLSVDDLLSDFVAETLECLETLSGEVVAWESDPSDRDRLDAFFRFFHTVKGSCGFLNLGRVEKLAHSAEDVLAAIRTGDRIPDPATITAVLAVMDRIGDIARAYGENETGPCESGDQMLLDSLVTATDQPELVEDDDKAADLATVEGEAETDAAPLNAAPAAHRDRPLRTVRISLSLIDQLMNAVSDMVLARNELSRKLRDNNVDPDVEGSFDRLSACVADMRDMVSKTRMQRVDRLFAALPRMVRDLSQELGKKAELVLEGGDVEMDREMIEMVVDPLTHIVRNALDHGLETPAERREQGKDPLGVIRISARQSGNQIVIEVVDNGRGIVTENLVAKAMRLKLIGDAEAAAMSHAEKLALIFHPGLSTAEKISAISGRGVGMDVVRTNVERIGGVVTLESMIGRGTTIQLRVPMTLTIIPGLILRCGPELFAIPRGNVIELLHENSTMVSLENVAGARVATIRGQRYSLIDLEDLLGRPRAEEAGTARTLMLVSSPTGVPYALGVDTVENHEELVIRPASPLVMAAGIFAGMTLPDNGRPMLLLDAAGIAQAADLPMELQKSEIATNAQESAEKRVQTIAALQFIEVGGQNRLIPLDTIERIEDIPVRQFGMAEGQPFVRLQDRLVRVVNPAPLSGDLIKTLHLRVGTQEACYVVHDVADIIDMPIKPHLRVQKQGIAGVVSHEGQHLEVIDTHSLFAALDPGAHRDDSNSSGICLISGLADDPWMRTILAPLLIQAGYDVRDADTTGNADGPSVLLCDAERTDAARDNVLPIIRIRAQADVDAGDPHMSIYRYDRAGLLAAVDGALRKQAA